MESDYAAPRFDVGSVLRLTFSCLGKNFGLFIGLAIIAALPSLVLENSFEDSPGRKLLFQLVGGFFTTVFEGAIAYGVFRTLRGERVGLGESLSRGLSRLFPLIVASFIINIGTAIGTLLLIVPGIILACMWSVTIPACVVENLGPLDSLQRSANLTDGYRWSIFGLMLLYIFAVLVIVFGAGFFFLLLTNDPVSAKLGAGILGILPTAVYTIMLAAVYYQLRSVTEGVAIDKLTSVFD